jgi:L-fucose mutarotase
MMGLGSRAPAPSAGHTEKVAMLKTRLLHPEILEALGTAGHGAQILIADGNYPLATRTAPTAKRVYLNLAPGVVTVTDVLSVLVDAIPIEAAHAMKTDTGEEPDIFGDFRRLLPGLQIQVHPRFDFYDIARGPDLALAIATGEQRIYANLLLTIGVVPPPKG